MQDGVENENIHSYTFSSLIYRLDDQGASPSYTGRLIARSSLIKSTLSVSLERDRECVKNASRASSALAWSTDSRTGAYTIVFEGAEEPVVGELGEDVTGEGSKKTRCPFRVARVGRFCRAWCWWLWDRLRCL